MTWTQAMTFTDQIHGFEDKLGHDMRAQLIAERNAARRVKAKQTK